MIKLVKWLLFLLIVFVVWFGFSFFINLKDEERLLMKENAIKAFNERKPVIFFGPLKEKMNEDLIKRKEQLAKSLRDKVKEVLERTPSW